MQYEYIGKKQYTKDENDNLVLMKPGTVVDLTPEQAINFRDKFRPVQSAPEVVVTTDETNDPPADATGDNTPADETVTPVETTE